MADLDDEIKKLQLERTKLTKVAFSVSKASYDDDIYGGTMDSFQGDDFSLEIGDESDSIPKGKGSGSKDAVRKALSSYTAPKHLLENRPRADPNKNEDDDPFKEFRRKTVAEREDEYRARWRKRKLSPPKVDPFNTDKGDKSSQSTEARSYRDIMMEQQLEKEQHDVMIKIAMKKKEEELDHVKRLKEKHGGTGWDVKDDGSAARQPPNRDNNRERGRDAERDRDRGRERQSGSEWVINILKGGQRIGDPIVLDPTKTLKIGRDRTSDITLDHPSCSKQHAEVAFRPSSSGSTPTPHIVDPGSTNGTFLDDNVLTASRHYEIKPGNVVKFGGSTREYVFALKD